MKTMRYLSCRSRSAGEGSKFLPLDFNTPFRWCFTKDHKKMASNKFMMRKYSNYHKYEDNDE